MHGMGVLSALERASTRC